MIELAGARLVAVLDASVLHSIRATNLLLQVATHNTFHPRWSDAIHDEWTRSVLRKNALADPAKLAKRRRDMDGYFPLALVTGFEAHIPSINLPDPDDRHVVAAGIAARADVIVTFNVRHFPAAALAPHGIEPLHPDAFLLELFDSDPGAVTASAAAVRQRLHAPPQTPDDFLRALAKAGLPRLAFELAQRKVQL